MVWAELDGPTDIGLAFGVGVGHETAPRAGLTHLVEHLALFDLDLRFPAANGTVDVVRSLFVTRGDRQRIAAFPAAIAERLASLPLDRLAHECQVLRHEAVRRGGSVEPPILGALFGLRGPGLLGQVEWSILEPDPVRTAAWAGAFSRRNAALWMTSRPPPTFGIGLPDVPVPLPVAADVRDIVERRVVRTEDVFVTGVAPRSTETNVAFDVAVRRVERRLRRELGWVYGMEDRRVAVSGDQAVLAMFVHGADGRGDLAGEIVRTLVALADGGPDPAEVDAVVERLDQMGRDDEVRAWLVHAASSIASNAPWEYPSTYAATARGTTPQAVAAIVGTWLSEATLGLPVGATVPAPFVEAPETDAVVEGQRFRPREEANKERFVLGQDVIGVEQPGGRLTLRFEDVAIAFVEPTARLLVGLDGRTIFVDRDTWRHGARLLRAVDDAVAPERWVAPGRASLPEFAPLLAPGPAPNAAVRRSIFGQSSIAGWLAKR